MSNVDMKKSMQDYFARLLLSTKEENIELSTVNLNCIKNQLIISEPNNAGWSKWLPVEKNIITDLSALERQYKAKFHQDLIDYYNAFWFYEIYGTARIEADNGEEYMFELNQVVPDQELIDLHQSIETYYAGGDINNFIMIPIGFLANFYVVLDNQTGEVLIDGRLVYGKFFKVANNIPEFISGLNV